MVSVSSRGFRPFARYLSHLIGDYQPPISTHIEGDSDAGRTIREQISDAMIAGLTSQQLGRLERTVSAVLGALRVDCLFRQGFSLRPWRPTNARQPGVQQVGGYGNFYEWRHDLSGWRDHTYRLVGKDRDGKPLEYFISEPYGLHEEGLRSLLKLADEGWRVRIDADWSLHYPGTTLRITLSRGND